MNDKKTITITMEEYNLLLEKQKQVDKLENRFENKACCNMSENCSMIQQAVKDTAKEIFAKAEKKAYFKDGGHYDKDRYLLDMADLKEILNGYGV